MKTILLMRHAKAELLAGGGSDFERPLTARGRDDTARMAKAVRRAAPGLGAIVASPARRARQTAEAMGKGLRHAGEIHWEKALYGAGGDAWIAALRKLPAGVDVVLVVAHNPGVEEAAAILAGAPPGFLDCPTAGVVAFDAAIASWKELAAGAGTLRWFLRPKLLEATE